MFRNPTLKCLTEIGALNVEEYNDKFGLLYEMVITSIMNMIPKDTGNFITIIYYNYYLNIKILLIFMMNK